MAVQLLQRRLAERHHLAVARPLRVKIRAALAAADRQTGQAVLENLLESQEFDDGKIHRRMETETSLVRSDRTVELHTVPVVHLHLTLVVDPRNTEQDLTLRCRQALQQRLSPVLLLVLLNDRADSSQEFPHGLMKLRLRRILRNDPIQDLIYIRHALFPPLEMV